MSITLSLFGPDTLPEPPFTSSSTLLWLPWTCSSLITLHACFWPVVFFSKSSDPCGRIQIWSRPQCKHYSGSHVGREMSSPSDSPGFSSAGSLDFIGLRLQIGVIAPHALPFSGIPYLTIFNHSNRCPSLDCRSKWPHALVHSSESGSVSYFLLAAYSTCPLASPHSGAFSTINPRSGLRCKNSMISQSIFAE